MDQSEILYNVSPKLIVKSSAVHGLGVFCIEDIKKDETIEVCRLLRLGWGLKYHHDPIIRDCCWTSGCKCKNCETHGQSMFLALGFGSIYNHAKINNLNTKFDYNKQYLVISAKDDIPSGQELFVNYGESYWNSRSKIPENILDKE